ncbi:hypothetical protein RI367_005841 [Sorochytrium milnesiophthora]
MGEKCGDRINVVAVCNDAYFDKSGAKTPRPAEKINPHLTDDLACSFALDAKNTLRDTLFRPAGHMSLPTTMVLNARNKVKYVGSTMPECTDLPRHVFTPALNRTPRAVHVKAVVFNDSSIGLWQSLTWPF